jgi:hypothetical protein
MTPDPRADELAEVIWRTLFNTTYAQQGLPMMTREQWEPVWDRLTPDERTLYRTIGEAVLVHLAGQRPEQEGCGPHHSYRGDPVDCEEYEGLVRAQAAAHAEYVAAHEQCIAEMQADQLTVAEQENELHEEKDRIIAAHSADILKIQTQMLTAETVIQVARNLLYCATTFNRDALRGALAQYDRALAEVGR